jgi:hypothetical protein
MRSSHLTLRTTATLCVALATGCDSSEQPSPGTGGSVASHGGSGAAGTGATAGTSGQANVCAGGPGTIDPGPCDPDPLRTNLAPLWNGNSVDAYDCPILKYTAQYNEPDAMIFKAIIYVESRFQYDAVGCTGNGPC